jgi:hypothetical protein|tara:strand:+ start:3083 stop:3517 length:435 start_codon:yes stop_codon:yes gene_type:complete
MAKYYSYEGKQVGWVRKTLDEVVLIEEAWTSEVNKYLAKNGYDELLMTVAKILDNAGQPPISRAQAWVLLHDLTNKGVPEALRNAEADEKIGFGKLVSSAKKGAATAVDTVTTPVGKVVGGAAKGVSNASKKIIRKGSADDADE